MSKSSIRLKLDTTAPPSPASAAAKGDTGNDDMERGADDLVRRIKEFEDEIVREEGRRQIISPVPNRPAEEEFEEHNATHTPPKPWRPYCMMGAGARDAHARIRKDMYLNEKGERPALVVVEHECGRVCAYALREGCTQRRRLDTEESGPRHWQC